MKGRDPGYDVIVRQFSVSAMQERRGWSLLRAGGALLLLTLLIGALAGCAAELPPSAFEGGTPEMRPEVFFAGATRSSGVLESSSGAPTSRFRVEGSGHALPDGQFRLDQTVTFDQRPPEARSWLMQRLDDHHYTATLTDASGTVEAEVYGNLFHLRYSMKSPLGGHMEQWLYLQPDGRTVMNEATISVVGVVVARLSERITHVD